MNFFDRTKKSATPRKASLHLALFGARRETDWYAVLGLFIALNIISMIVNYFIFSGVRGEELFTVEKKEIIPPDTFNKEQLDDLVGYYKDKKERFDDFREKPIELSDPSL